ncbi:uncharacterized protein (TIGR02646 family) [Pedobacter sp. AK013]|uniref:hypothetical protein n=1 Tax=Pedobacter sp. AK013 TaxID=2723071 RepID=UPI001612A45E|nr:hypothetical protein [Pedobacter sp. AK013]MBB6239952.1 uncharacterized protein (TIGR02646 family) [Pedobacter sp. AK013]
MIFVDRKAVPAPAVLTVAGGRGLRERGRAIANFGPGGPKNAFTYSAYTDDTVRDTLTLLFKKKCAYCESNFVHTSFRNVEHFRPKGEITEAVAPKSPGYYWLASDWDNLLLSCTLCNSQQRHAVHGSTVVESLGKMNQFPLHNFLHVRDHTVGIATEEPRRLLINPCKDNPEYFLSYGNEGNILPKGQRGMRRLKGEKSIKVYALQRMDLVDERKKLRIAIELQQDRIVENTKLFLDFLPIDPLRATQFEDTMAREMKVLKDYMKPQSPFSGMAKEMIKMFIIHHQGLLAAKVLPNP